MDLLACLVGQWLLPFSITNRHQAADQFLAQLQEKEKKLESLMRNVGLKDRATVEEALRELAGLKEQVAEESKPEVVHVPAHLVLLKRDDILKEGELVVVRHDGVIMA